VTIESKKTEKKKKKRRRRNNLAVNALSSKL